MCEGSNRGQIRGNDAQIRSNIAQNLANCAKMLNQCSAVCVSNCRQKKEKLSPPFEKILGGNVKGTDVAAVVLKGLGEFKMGKMQGL